MPNKKKTRKQKKASDVRRIAPLNTPRETSEKNVFSYSTETPIVESPSKIPSSKIPSSQTITTNKYSFVTQDLKKTLAITGIIIVMQFILFFVMQ